MKKKMGGSFSVQHSSLIDALGEVYKQSGSVTLIRTDCEIFVTHCTCPTSQIQRWSEQ